MPSVTIEGADTAAVAAASAVAAIWTVYLLRPVIVAVSLRLAGVKGTSVDDRAKAISQILDASAPAAPPSILPRLPALRRSADRAVGHPGRDVLPKVDADDVPVEVRPALGQLQQAVDADLEPLDAVEADALSPGLRAVDD